MHIEHIALWTRDLERMRDFYQRFFKVSTSTKYENIRTGFSSYFLSFDNGARLEIMHRPDINITAENGPFVGLVHFAVSLGSKTNVDELTTKFKESGYKVVSEPRTTGDRYYESIIEDPDGNRIELTI